MRPFLQTLTLMSLCLVPVAGCMTGTTEGYGTDGSIAVLEPIPVGGVEQWLLIRGQDTTKPVLLMVHGGPGAAEMPINRVLLDDLTSDFIVVSWDQRGAGKSYDPENPTPNFNMSQFARDIDEVVDHLLQRFDRDKLFIHGHSWGTMIGALYVEQHPEKVHAYVGTGQIVNAHENFVLGNRWLRDQIIAAGNDADLAELDDIERIQAGGDWVLADYDLHVRRSTLLNTYGGIIHPDSDVTSMVLALFTQSEYTFDEVMASQDRAIAEAAFEAIRDDPAYAPNFKETLPALDVPVFFIKGEVDQMARGDLIDEWAALLDAPRVESAVVAQTGHTPQVEQPEAFMDTLRGFLLDVDVN